MPGSEAARLELFGGFRLTSATGADIAVSSRKNRALLAILALAPGCTASRDQLVPLLWGDRGEQQARNSLRQALVALRRDLAAIEPSPLVLQDDRVKLDLARFSIDVVAFRDLAAAGNWSAAAELYRGTLLAGLNPSGEAFEDWLRLQRDLVIGKAVTVLEQLAAEQRGEARIATAKRLLALDPLREASHRALMSAYHEAGETALALKQYEACRDMLKRELGVAAAQATEELRRAIAIAKDTPQPVAPAPQRAQHARPSIAVLPFTSLGAPADQQFLCDGIVSDIILALSRFRSLAVIARPSSFAFRDSPLGIAEIGTKLGANYLVTGSLRTLGKRVQFSVELIDVGTQAVVWAQNYARELAEIFALQDEVVRTIAATLTDQVELDIATRAAHKHPGSVAVYDLGMRGLQHQQRTTRKDTPLAIDYLERAIALDPSYSEAYGWLSIALLLKWQFDYDRPALDRAIKVAQQGVELDPYSARCHMMLGYCLLTAGDRVRGETHGRRALALNPGDAYITAQFSLIEAYKGRPDECLRYLDAAQALNPYPPAWHEEFHSVAAFVAGRYEDARIGFENAPDTYWDKLYLLACNGHLGLREEADTLLAWFRAQFSKLPLIEAARMEPFWREEDRARLVEGIEKAIALTRGGTVVRLERR
ncbi:BTAD domain-containing putative transcriptional regulator [Dongia deserti]|uniref:BTAD domain-containing putative transcriptional regulator n=1 Tax=Dongia deserti TaxID=2268030 RepID=UPI0013C4BDEB|nr:BTAD domain-containing putative transcriptional regulator [Dongia deserti]